MRIHKSTILGGLTAILLASSSAIAADVNGRGASTKDAPTGFEAPAVVWTGLYLGAHGGWATGHWDGLLAYTNPETGETTNAGYDDPRRELETDGFYGGLQVGYNVHVARLVLGVEADASFGDVSGSETYATDEWDGGFRKKHEFEMEWFGTARVRAGIAVGRFLPYVTGGLAWAKTKGDLTVSYDPECCGPADQVSTASADETHVGWTAGGGVEAAVGDGWSFKVEYLYVDLGEQDYDFKGHVYNGAPFDTDSFKDAGLTFHTVRAGLNYRFGGVRLPLE